MCCLMYQFNVSWINATLTRTRRCQGFPVSACAVCTSSAFRITSIIIVIITNVCVEVFVFVLYATYTCLCDAGQSWDVLQRESTADKQSVFSVMMLSGGAVSYSVLLHSPSLAPEALAAAYLENREGAGQGLGGRHFNHEGRRRVFIGGTFRRDFLSLEGALQLHLPC